MNNFITKISYITVRALSAATGVPEVDNSINSFLGIVYGLARVGGVGMVVWGIVQFAISLQQHDASQKMSGIYMIVGGVLIAFAKEILTFLGIVV